MSQPLITVLRATLLPSVERLEKSELVLPGGAGKAPFGPYPPRPGQGDAAPPGAELPHADFNYGGHPTLELVFGFMGRAELALDGQRYVLAEGEAALVPPNCPHLERLLSLDQAYHLVWFRVGPDRIAIHGSSYSRGNRFQLVRGATVSPSGPICRYFESAIDEARERAPLWFSLVRARLTEGLVRVIRHLEEHGPGQTPEQARQSVVDVAKRFIQSHFSDDLSLERIAGEVYLSPNYFSSLFTQGSGQTVFEYLQQVRLDEAQRLLRETEYSIHEVARRVGVHTPSYFSRLFKRHTGLSAREFRQKAQSARP
ncbi:MAG: AraC family transcriptional regulator [Planctomycetota bacterium]|nr:AraC family transcriptional regulator [Planctomycetota bacterium]